MSRLPAALTCLVLAVSLTACGSDDGGDDPTLAEPSSSTPSSPAEQECEERPATEEPGADATTDLTVKPEAQIDGPPPCDLVITDVVVGEGEEAVQGTVAQVKYVGVLYDGGEEFDSSWSRGADETLPVPVGGGGVIPGFDQAVTGMREGGRRQVVIPSELGYGPTGQGPIPPNATLVFVIDMVDVSPA